MSDEWLQSLNLELSIALKPQVQLGLLDREKNANPCPAEQ